MRRAMQGILPPTIQWRGAKSDMAPGFQYGLLAHERQRLEQVILDAPQVIEPYVDLIRLREAYQHYLAGNATDFEVNAVWRAVSLALWLQRTALTP
jgi:asparagine synthase (glutamine-hydrolysing)